jgi:hypothetical protein
MTGYGGRCFRWIGDQPMNHKGFINLNLRSMRDIVVFCGQSHPELGLAIAERLGIPLGQVKLGKFSNCETLVQVYESVVSSYSALTIPIVNKPPCKA